MNSYQAKAIPIATLLYALGYEPHHQRGEQWWYLSPFRHETKPSFNIHIGENIWYDFGLGKGGNVLDFVMTLHQLTSVKDALRVLEQLDGLPVAIAADNPDSPPKPTPQATSGKLTLKKCQPLQNRALIQYLEQRGITETIAKPYVQEAYYTVPGKERTYFALAFPNDSGGYELRNPYFQGVVGSKALSYLPGTQTDAGLVTVFEGFTDFLSALVYWRTPKPTFPALILNSVALKQRAVDLLSEMEVQTIHLYLDRDASGRALTQVFHEEMDGVEVIDHSDIYKGYKDFNAFLVHTRSHTMA